MLLSNSIDGEPDYFCTLRCFPVLIYQINNGACGVVWNNFLIKFHVQVDGPHAVDNVQPSISYICNKKYYCASWFGWLMVFFCNGMIVCG